MFWLNWCKMLWTLDTRMDGRANICKYNWRDHSHKTTSLSCKQAQGSRANAHHWGTVEHQWPLTRLVWTMPLKSRKASACRVSLATFNKNSGRSTSRSLYLTLSTLASSPLTLTPLSIEMTTSFRFFGKNSETVMIRSFLPRLQSWNEVGNMDWNLG